MTNLEHPDALLTKRLGTYTHDYDERDLVLYALGVGCGVQDRKYVYECAADFSALPTFAVIPAHPVAFGVPLEHYVPNYDRSKTLHGEQYLELHAPLPHAATVVTRAEVLDVQDKGKGAVVVLRATTVDAASGHLLAVNEFTSFALGTAPFQGVSHPRPRPAAATAPNAPPAGREPDVAVEAATGADQAALYRLSGDYNPLHIDPAVSKRAGFPIPILHGLCTMGISAKHVLRAAGGDDPASVASIKVRFAKHVLPGETLRVEMWQVDPVTVVFQTRVVERNVLAITNAAMVFKQPVQMGGKQQQQRTQAKL